MLTYRTGDLLKAGTGEVDAIAHGCNCQGMMGSGIAAGVRRTYGEEMFQEYAGLCATGRFYLGSVHRWETPGLPVLFNLGTQFQGGPDARTEAITLAVYRMLEQVIPVGCTGPTNHRITVGLPRIGAGIGGLRWDDVERALLTAGAFFPSYDLVIYTLP